MLFRSGGSVVKRLTWAQVHEFKPRNELSAVSAELSLSLPLFLPLLHSYMLSLSLSLSLSNINKHWGAWVAQSVERLTSAQVMILWFVSSSPASGCVPTAQSLEPASDSVSPSLSAPLCSHSVSVFLSQK